MAAKSLNSAGNTGTGSVSDNTQRIVTKTANRSAQTNLNMPRRQNGDFKVREAFRTLRSNIQFCGSEFKTIVLTSCIPNEGKSYVSMMCAEAFAELDNKKVLLIDADLRKSVLKKRMRMNNRKSKGLSHFLSGQASLSEVILPSDRVENLDIIFAGPYPPNPSELLAGEMFRLGLQKLRDKYDYIIIDAPPIGSVIDAAIIAKEADGTVMVIAANTVSYRLAQGAKEQLEKTGCRILGAVLNQVNVKESKYYGNYYGGYYGKYYGSYYGD